MKLTQILLRKRKMHIKPQSHTRHQQWNNHWFLQQERTVQNFGMVESLVQRGIPVCKPEELCSPVVERIKEHFHFDHTKLESLPKNSDHPLWHDSPAFTFNNRTWLPKDMEVEFVLAASNSLEVAALPDRVLERQRELPGDLSQELRLEGAIRSAWMGDATQKLLPKNWKVPYIGWHPVESKMRPRNQYDYTKFSYQWNEGPKFGVPIPRKLSNLTRGLVAEVFKSCPDVSSSLVCSGEAAVERQFLHTPGGDLIRLYLDLPVAVTSSRPLAQAASEQQVLDTQDTPVVNIEPQSPLAALRPTNIYRDVNAHPVTSLLHSHPYINTVFDFLTTPHGCPMTDERSWKVTYEKGKCLMLGFAAAIGQARLIYGEEVEGVLPKPVTVNAVTTNGVWWQMSTFQLNTMDLGSDVKNLFYHHPEPLRLFDYCGYREARPELEGVNKETFSMLQSLLTAGLE